MYTSKLLVFVAALLLACTNNVVSNGSLHLPALDSYDFYVDGHDDGQLHQAVQVAATQWTEYTGVKITIHGGDRVCAEGCFTIFEPSQSLLDFVTFEPNWIGATDVGIVAVAQHLSQAETQETMIHEMGHALGLGHHEHVSAVMEPSYGTATKHVTCDDVKQYFSVRNRAVPKGLTACSN